MICHVCHNPASGQCQVCARFYCPTHGYLVCTVCKENPEAAQPSQKGVAPEPVFAEPKACYECRQATTIKCDGCENYFCSRHGIGYSEWGETGFKCSG